MSVSKPQKERDKAIGHLFDYIERSPRWSPLFEELTRQMVVPVANYFDTDVNQVMADLLDGDYGFMAFGFLMEHMAVTSWDNNSETPIDVFLKQRGWREGPHGRRYLRALIESDHELLEVTRVEPGRWIEVRPQGTVAHPERIVEHSASQSLHPYDCIVARMVTLGKKRRFGGMLPMSSAGVSYVCEELDKVASDLTEWYEEAVADGDAEGLVKNFADEIPMERKRRITEVGFMCWAIDVLEPPAMTAPRLQNTDDQRIVMTKFRFPVVGESARIRERLASQTDIVTDSDNHWSWIKAGESNTVLGHFTLDNDHLIVETNSVERGKHGVALVQSLLGDDLVGPPLGVHENIEDLMASMPVSSPPASSNDLQQLPSVQALVQETMKSHYRKTLDEDIPMLDNESPRTCAADPAKHDKVVNWLKYLENTESKSPNPTQDFGWMWDELGLSKYR